MKSDGRKSFRRGRNPADFRFSRRFCTRAQARAACLWLTSITRPRLSGPRQVIQAIVDTYEKQHANVHAGSLAERPEHDL